MSFYNYNGILIAISALSGAQTFSASPPPSSGDISVAVLATYVDNTGVRQSINPLLGGGTTITGVAPLFVTIDATATRAPTAFAAYAGSEDLYLASGHTNEADPSAAAAEAFATVGCGFRINYGGGTGAGNWPYPEGAGASKNEDFGHPLWHPCFTEVGTHTVQIKVKDTLGNEATVSFNVVVQAPPSATHIAVAAGSWPTFTSGTRYTLDAGGDYRSFGTLETGGMHNILFEKLGAGADPRISTWSVDGRSKFGETTMFAPRARAVRMLGIDMDIMQEGQRGFDYCGVVNGRVRRYESGPQDFAFNEGTTTERSVCRFVRGCFFVGSTLNNIGSGGGFTLFGTWNALAMSGCLVDAIDTGPSTWLVLRVYGTKHGLRHSKVRISHAETSACGTPLSLLSGAGAVETTWPDTDLPAALGDSERYGLRNDHSHGYRLQFYDATSSRANAVFSQGGNPEGTHLVRPRIGGLEDCVWWQPNATAVGMLSEDVELAGRGMFSRNLRKNMGAGNSLTSVPENPNQGATGSPTTWHGPYGVDLEARPIPSAFV